MQGRIAVGVVVLALAGCGSDGGKPADTQAAVDESQTDSDGDGTYDLYDPKPHDPSIANSEDEANGGGGSVQPKPKAETDLTCDYVLGDQGDSGDPAKGYRFIGGGTITNTGDVAVNVAVAFKWKQLGSPPIRKMKLYKVQPGQTRDVNVTVIATQDQIDLYQSADESGKGCSAKGVIV